MNLPIDLNVTWFVLIGVLIMGYAILDGFDLGVGALHLLTASDRDRRVFLNSIGPVWDGNEVWLVTGGGALFAAFPDVYATLASGFYLAVFLLLFSLIFRAVSIEFRSKEPMLWWRRFWDGSFCVSSILVSFLLGVVVGNLALGIPLGADKEFAGTFLGLLNPYAILVGITTVALFVLHGAVYLVTKTEGPLYQQVRGWINRCIIFFVVCYVAITVATLVYLPWMADRVREYPWLVVIPLINAAAVANIPRALQKGKEGQAFFSSSLVIATLILLFGIGIFPNLVPSNPFPEYSLTIYNAASSQKTLSIMLTIALIGMPLVVGYTAAIYWIFRGKVKLNDMSY